MALKKSVLPKVVQDALNVNNPPKSNPPIDLNNPPKSPFPLKENAPLPVTQVPNIPTTAPKTPQVFRDEKGNLSGITTTTGNTYLGLTPNVVQTIAAQEQKKIEENKTPLGAVDLGQQAQQQKNAEAIANQETIAQKFEKQTTPINATSMDARNALNPFTGNSMPAFANTISQGANIIEKFSSFLPEVFQFGTSKSVEVKKAEATFMDNANSIDMSINNYKAGLGSKSEIQRQIDGSINTITDLYAQTKGKGQLDLRFWLDKGKEIEAQINLELGRLEQQQRQLNALP